MDARLERIIRAAMSQDFEKVREIMRGIATLLENMWIEREALTMMLIHVHSVSYETIETAMNAAKADPKLRDAAQQAFAQMRKSLEDESFDILAEELMKQAPKSDKPN